jgi:hypothetical protein
MTPTKMRRPKSVTTNYRPPIAGKNPSLERNARPGAGACPAARHMTLHEVMLDGVSDVMLDGIIRDAETKNLLNLRDHETRWWAERSKVARALRRERKGSGVWTIVKPVTAVVRMRS